MSKGRLLRPRSHVIHEEQSYRVSITIPEDWLDLDGETFHERMDDALGAMMRVFEAGRTQRAKERERG